jgi:glycosyltransferase involved in cell wall biosynthesis
MLNKTFIFVNTQNENLSGGNIYNAAIGQSLLDLGIEVLYEDQLYHKNAVNKDAVIILDSIIIDESLDLNFYKDLNAYFLIHLWPSCNADLNEEKRNKILSKQKEICENYKLIFAGEHSFYQTKEFFTGTLKPYFIIPPGVNSNWKVKEVYKKTATKFICIGNLCKRKRQLELLEAFNTNNKIKLTLVGRSDDQDYRNKIDTYIIDNNLDVSIAEEINHENINKLMIEHDALLLFSEEENNSIALIESIATGLPFITTPTGNYRRYLESSVGIVAKDFNIENFEMAIKQISEDELFYSKEVLKVKNFKVNSWKESAQLFANL